MYDEYALETLRRFDSAPCYGQFLKEGNMILCSLLGFAALVTSIPIIFGIAWLAGCFIEFVTGEDLDFTERIAFGILAAIFVAMIVLLSMMIGTSICAFLACK